MVISNLTTKLIQDRLGFVVSCVEREMGAFLEAYNAFKRNDRLS